MKSWKVLMLLASAVFLQACGGAEQVEDHPDGIQIVGNIEGGEGQSVTMWVFEGGGDELIDSSIVENGTFELWTQTKELREYVIEFGSPSTSLTNAVNNLIYIFPDETSGKIEISGSFPGIGDNYRVTGDQNSEDFNAYLNFRRPLREQTNRLMGQHQNSVDPEQKALLMQEVDSLHQLTRQYAIDYINEKPGSPVSWVVLTEFYPPTGIADFDSTDLAYFEIVGDAMREKYPYSEYPEYVDMSIENTLAQMQELKGGGSGEMAPELAYANPDGEVISLSSLRGKVVLIDFWASWCGPCRMENPNVVKTYNEYKDKGFTVYSVSLDTDKNKWIQAIENDNLSWPNHVSDLKGWQSEAAAIYGVNSIPATFLLDTEGRIIDQNLRGGRLEQRLQEILG